MNIKIKDQDYTLKYRNKELFAIEEKVGVSIIDLFQDENKLKMLNVIYTILWCGIQEDISYDDFCNDYDLVEATNLLPKVVNEIAKAFETGSKKK
jgi:hypothetical protein